jgi:hypothetical protein
MDRRQSPLALALAVVVLVIAALLVTAFTLPLLGRSKVEFAAIAGVCWAAIFAGTGLLTRSLGRSSRLAAGEGSARETLAQGAERVLDDEVAHPLRVEPLVKAPAGLEKRPY